MVGFYKPREAVEIGADIGIPEVLKAQGADKEKHGDGANARDHNGDPDTAQEKAQSEQREAKLKAILATNYVWPCVQFHSGPLMLCVPLSFEVINADARIEVVREQVCVHCLLVFMIK